LIARDVLGHDVFAKGKRLFERTDRGERPLRQYDADLNDAWEVVERLNMTLIPIKDEGWFAFVGKNEGWASPAEFLQFLQSGEFVGCGAAVGKSPSKTICHAALNALERRQSEAQKANGHPMMPEPAPQQH